MREVSRGLGYSIFTSEKPGNLSSRLFEPNQLLYSKRSEEVGDSLAFLEEFISCLLDASNGDFVIQLEALDWGIHAWGRSAGEREHESLWNVVKLSI